LYVKYIFTFFEDIDRYKKNMNVLNFIEHFTNFEIDWAIKQSQKSKYALQQPV
jgi:hypothetical protein